jgi:hypothetical protein
MPFGVFLALIRRSIGSFYAFILNRSGRVRLTVVARSNYEAVLANVCVTRRPVPKAILTSLCRRELPLTVRTMAIATSVPIKVSCENQKHG